MYWIYTITNNINGKRYVGFSTNIVERVRAHKKRNNGCPRLLTAFKRYGIKNFSIEILECGKDELFGKNIRESYWIGKLSPEYNLTVGGDGVIGYRHTDETKRHLAEVQKGKSHSEETRRKISKNSFSKRDPEAQRLHAIKAGKARALQAKLRRINADVG